MSQGWRWYRTDRGPRHIPANPQRRRALRLLVLLPLTIEPSLAAGQARPGASGLFAPKRTLADARIEERILDLVNAHRARLGLSELRLDARLVAAARAHSEYMNRTLLLSHRGYRDSDFADRAGAAGYAGFPRAENIAWNYPTAEAVMQGWLASPPHRENMELRDVTDLGIGMIEDPDSSETWWTMVLGRSYGKGSTGQ